MKPIVHIPNPVLTTPGKTITVFDKRLSALVSEMKKTLLATKNPKGVGLAAPQVGEGYRLFLTKPTDRSVIRVFINPEISASSEDLTDGIPERENKLEGCLSIPHIWGKVRRAQHLTLRFQDEQGKHHEESFKGFLATIIQHETDHTNGILFTRRVLEQHEKFYQIAQDREGKEILEEISI